MKKIISTCLLLLIIALLTVPNIVSFADYTVGQGISHVANGQSGGSSSGSSNNTSSDFEETSEQTANRNRYNSYNSKCSNLISDYFDTDFNNITPTVSNGSQYVNVQTQSIPVSELSNIANGYDLWNNINYYNNVPTQSTSYSFNGYSPSNNEKQAFKDAKNYSQNTLLPLYNMNYSNALYDNWNEYYKALNSSPNTPSAFYWNSNKKNKSDIKDAYNSLMDSFNSGSTRNTLIDGLDITDFSTYKDRQKALSNYLDDYKNTKNNYWDGVEVEDDIKVVYIKEVNIEDVKQEVLYKSYVQNWPLYNKPIQVEFSYLSDDGVAAQKQYANNGESITMVPMIAGTYKWTETQIFETTYSNVMSYTYNQYLIVADTGQVIWSDVSVGDSLSDTSYSPTYAFKNEYTSSLDSQAESVDSQIRETKTLETTTEYFETYSNTYDVSESNLNNNGITRSVFNKNFSTKRIE